MVQVNRQTDYAIRVILALAKHPPGTRRATSEIRDEMLIPPALSQRIVADLAQGGFIQTFPGRSGGIQLARPAEQINLLQVVEYVQGLIYVSQCLITKGEPCNFQKTCPVRKRWAKLQTLIREELASQTFDLLTQDAIEAQGLIHQG